MAQEQARVARALVGTQSSNESGTIAMLQQQLSALASERDAATAQLARVQVCICMRVACGYDEGDAGLVKPVPILLLHSASTSLFVPIGSAHTFALPACLPE
eukprot:scaffold2679_cov18-Tisochrysis_lutea.AAC.2